VEGEHKQEHVHVSVVTPVAYHALDHLPKRDLAVLQSLTRDGADTELGVLAL